MSELLKKLRKNTVVQPEILKNSRYYQNADNEIIHTRIPILNLAFTGRLRTGGIPRGGIVMIAAPPKHFKTSFLIEGIAAFQEDTKDTDAITVYYDCEKGSTLHYFTAAGIDTSKIDYRFVTSIEELRSDLANLVEDISEGDNVMIVITLGSLPSNKEIEDAKSENHKADFTRAKAIKSLFRIITPHIIKNNIPTLVENHSYQEIGLYPREIAGGGRGAQFAGHTLWFISKAEEKEGDELVGHRFTIKTGLSRYVQEKSTFPVVAKFGLGIEKYSGIFDLGLEFGFIEKVTAQTYVLKGETVAAKRKNMEYNEEIMERLLSNDDFVNAVEKSVLL